MKNILLCFSLVVLIFFTGCNSNEKKNTELEETTAEIEANNEPNEFTDTKWKLVTLLMGQDITDDKAFISFATEDNRVFGNNSCNNFTGTYEIKEGSQIILSKIATTMMSCPDMTIGEQFMAVLEKADNYSLNGNYMTLNKAKMAPLAVFEVWE